MWMAFKCGAKFVSGTALTRQHFVCGCPEGLLDVGNFGKLFLSFFLTAFAGIQHLVGENSSPMECRNALPMRAEGDNPVTIPCRQYGL